jgi:hypothetical protein
VARCTICGVRVVHAGHPVHMAAGRTFRYSDQYVSHDATTDPRYLVLWLRWR